MRVGLGADHAGCALKARLAEHLSRAGHEVVDFGTRDPAVPVDYPQVARAVAEAVARGEVQRGILCCGTGIGMSIAANKVAGVRAALVHDVTTARLCRQHNDANVLCLGSRLLAPELARELVDVYLGTDFEPRHQGRVDQIRDLERCLG